jgi:hypothetical protein
MQVSSPCLWLDTPQEVFFVSFCEDVIFPSEMLVLFELHL